MGGCKCGKYFIQAFIHLLGEYFETGSSWKHGKMEKSDTRV